MQSSNNQTSQSRFHNYRLFGTYSAVSMSNFYFQRSGMVLTFDICSLAQRNTGVSWEDRIGYVLGIAMFQKPNYVTLQLHWGYFAFSQAAHCSEAHVQSQWERANFDPQWHQNPWIFSNLNFTFMSMSWSSTSVQIFISICSVGASPQIGEILWFCDFFPRYCIFLGPRSNPWMDFHGLWLIRRVFAQGKRPRAKSSFLLGVTTISEFI